ncbi:hypothetical protein VQH23_05680 [Pararoseomonas sp. SCSIO 73927]|uniref:hypothetical protein n=1 Tax=Pararoseomonas sp. SCSIO 73927 TaxID=3114537 RepID=UPI0030D59C30
MNAVEQGRAGARTAAPVAAVLLLLAAPAAAEARRGVPRGDAESFAMGACLTRQTPERLRDEGFLWTRAVMERGGDLATWRALGDAVVAEAARRPVPQGRGDGPVADPLTPMPVLHCHEVVRSPAVRAAITRAVRGAR